MASFSCISSVILLFFSLFNPISAWYIDDDCTDDQKAFIRTALGNSFGLNNFAQIVISPGAALNDQQKQLLTWLFGPYDDYTYQSVFAITNGISNMNHEQAKDDLGRNDFRVYCTTNRLKLTTYKGRPKYYDPDINENLSITSKLDCAYNLAYAYTSVKNPLSYSQLQICPWFLQYAMKQNPQFQDAITKTMWGSILNGLRFIPAAKKLLYTDVDIMGLFDKVILHELTHTRGGGQTMDVNGISGYGWKNCRKLSTVRTDTASRVYGPEKNADTIALFASAAQLITAGGTLNEDGSFTEPPSSKLKRMLGIGPGLRGRPIW